MRVPPVLIHVIFGFTKKNIPIFGVPPSMETLISHVLLDNTTFFARKKRATPHSYETPWVPWARGQVLPDRGLVRYIVSNQIIIIYNIIYIYISYIIYHIYTYLIYIYIIYISYIIYLILYIIYIYIIYRYLIYIYIIYYILYIYTHYILYIYVLYIYLSYIYIYICMSYI